MKSSPRQASLCSPFKSSIQTPNENLNGPEISQQKLMLFRSSEDMKPCEKFGLDTKKLQIQQLLKNRSYRRLYNIVAHDQTSGAQVFRPNLIKELYFLLQITPFIENSLRDGFLNRIQQWYNSNDHKKIKLSKNLENIITNVLQVKPKTEKEFKKSTARPKSGVQWDTSLSPFLRPYTAKLRTTKNSKHHTISRPQSSKFEKSTKANTNYVQEHQELQKQENENRNSLDEKEIEQICDIEEEWQRSLDFKKKYRTLHPEEEPTYSKLMGLITAVKQQIDLKENKETSVSTIGYKSNQYWQKKRMIQSAKATQQLKNAAVLAQKELDFQNELQIAEERLKNQQFYDDIDRQQQQDHEADQDVVNLDDSRPKFTSDARSKQGKKLLPYKRGKMYANLNGIKILRPFTAKESNIIGKLDQYSTLQQNKRVMLSDLDQECLEKYIQFMKNKNSIKRQIFRKSESKRYMDNFKEIVRIIPRKSTSKENNGSQSLKNKENIHSDLDQKKIKPGPTTQQQSKTNGLQYDFVAPHQKLQGLVRSKPKYNVKTYFEQIKAKTISTKSRGISKIQPEGLKHEAKMTFQRRVISQQKFDPLHINNLENYNKEAMDQIQKIKLRFGGKISASTDNLMKALYVDAPLPFMSHNDNQLSSKFQVPDKNYLLIQKQEKKKKKRKLRKMGAIKTLSKSKR